MMQVNIFAWKIPKDNLKKRNQLYRELFGTIKIRSVDGQAMEIGKKVHIEQVSEGKIIGHDFCRLDSNVLVVERKGADRVRETQKDLGLPYVEYKSRVRDDSLVCGSILFARRPPEILPRSPEDTTRAPDEAMKRDAVPAESVVLAPLNIKLNVDRDFIAFVKSRLANTPLSEGDTKVIYIFDRPIDLKVISTEPKRIVLIQDTTHVHILSKPLLTE